MTFYIMGQLIEHFSNQRPYLDPSSGSILIQLLLAGLLGAGILLRTYWSRILKLFGRGKQDQTDDGEDE
ncbi:MAG: hypothetical protein A2X25_00540 [Chloroflexi bacterium GWB2_49_20]|nr:MAG: hypothetical protein A2X25_00540 [Chloroflexi bacterium GWB2_49_20]OGN80167.1 MAG: hypothetical protein A2X26_09395 [Chloroflexi bacterium GWC2_49_37]OGN83140.1 MAG: hypothetical protein A2X27_13155 [Chloroflexi bacterium GWD2_49_16]